MAHLGRTSGTTLGRTLGRIPGPGRALGTIGLTSRARGVERVAEAPAPHRRPDPALLLGELAGWAGAARLWAASPRLALGPRGDGSVVIDLPGWRAPELTGLPIRTYLRSLGHDARSWGLGTNTGRPTRDIALLAAAVREVAAARGPVSLVGWSLGGLIAREVARREPDAVRRVVTYGSPVRLGRRLGTGTPIRVPVTAVLSRRDGVVDWRACLDRTSPDVRHVEVGSTHLGLGVDPDVWRVVAEALAGR